MMINAELAALFRRPPGPHRPARNDGAAPVDASEMLHPGLPDLLPNADRALGEVRRKNSTSAKQRASRDGKVREVDVDDQAPGDRRRENRAVLIDTRLSRGRREADLNTAIDFTI